MCSAILQSMACEREWKLGYFSWNIMLLRFISVHYITRATELNCSGLTTGFFPCVGWYSALFFFFLLGFKFIETVLYLRLQNLLNSCRLYWITISKACYKNRIDKIRVLPFNKEGVWIVPKMSLQSFFDSLKI